MFLPVVRNTLNTVYRNPQGQMYIQRPGARVTDLTVIVTVG